MMKSYKECAAYAQECIQNDDFMMFSDDEYNSYQVDFYIYGMCATRAYHIYLDGIVYIMCSETAKRKLQEYAAAKSYQQLINLLSM